MTVTKGNTPEEVSRLLEINDACYRGIELPTHAEFKGMLQSSVTFVVKIQGAIVGFAVVRSYNYLWSLAVLPTYRGLGIGRDLLRGVIEACTLAKEKEISLHVHPTNPAQKIYFDHGFRVEAIAKNWYKREGNGLYMRRPLP